MKFSSIPIVSIPNVYRKPNLTDLLNELPIDCRAATERALLLCVDAETIPANEARAAIKSLVESVHRVEQRRDSDHATDGRRRKLVGARVPITAYRRYAAAAAVSGMSLYRWCVQAFEAAWRADFEH